MLRTRWTLAAGASLLFAAVTSAAPLLKVLIVDGQNNHKWEQTTPVLKKILEETGRFRVDVATSPPKGEDMSGFRPDFAAYDVVVSNYNGEPWCVEAKAAFENYVREGGGFVVYHAADNAFPAWREYNEMIALGGWGGRTEEHGPRILWRDRKIIFDTRPGKAGHHGKRHPFLIVTRNPRHPIMDGLPNAWQHATDELYDSLRGPARDMDILATAYSDPSTGGTGENELILLTVRYAKGRVFHTPLGHDVAAMQCVGFITTLQRGTEWAATGKVKQKAPRDFPTTMRVSIRN
jgi:type 1 glutamine amidotransferase